VAKDYSEVPDKGVGDGFTESMWDDSIRDNINTLITQPYAWVRRASSDQTIPDSTFTILNWDTEDEDNDLIWNAGSAARFTPDTEGLYLFLATISWETTASSSTAVIAQIQRNNQEVLGEDRRKHAMGYSSTKHQVFGIGYFNGSTDYVHIKLYQDSGGDLDIITDSDGVGNSPCRFQAYRLGIISF